jgi:hypothetical protein
MFLREVLRDLVRILFHSPDDARSSAAAQGMTGTAKRVVTAADIERELASRAVTLDPPSETPRSGTAGTHLADLQRIGREIRARVERLDRIGAKAVNMAASINHLLGQAEALCTPEGFVAFKQCYCPELGRSRIYELIAIEQGRKTVEQVRAAGRARVAKHRKARAMVIASPPVTDRESVTADPQPESDPAVADPAEIEDNVLYSLARVNEHTRVFKKLFKLSTFDPEAETRIITAIEDAAAKLMSLAQTLRRKCNQNPR